jgi:histidine triad (HIT) family protein
MTSADCPFCAIVAGRLAASIVDADEHTIAFVDLRQFHPGHVLIVPRRHIPDIRALAGDDAGAIGAALMAATARIARAVDAAFPSDGMSIWHSAGAGANQEVPHMHLHVHPRSVEDDVLRVYPRAPATPDRATLDQYASRIKGKLGI